SCNNCKKHKIKCDKEMPQCKSCFKKGVPCLSACPSTQREVPRSYLLYLEDLLYVYSKKLRELGVDCDELKSNFPTTSMD
ncbi:A Ppr1-Dna Complex: Dna recognition By proteins containing A Zn2cys6 binuclear cluster, partial [Hanseniaspora valbyensis NRRL Y-1626]